MQISAIYPAKETNLSIILIDFADLISRFPSTGAATSEIDIRNMLK